MPSEIIFLPRAEKDLLDLPRKVQDEILTKIETLRQFPYIGQKMEKAYTDYRFLLAGRNLYRIIYKILSPRRIVIAYIRHCSRQLGLRLVKH